MNAVMAPATGRGRTAAWPGHSTDESAEASAAGIESRKLHQDQVDDLHANQAWEIDRQLMLERSERRAWRVASAGLLAGLVGIAAVFVQGPLRRIVEIPIVVDRQTGETTVQQRLAVETVPTLEALDKHNLATFVRAREGYSWMFLQRDFEQVSRMAVPAVFGDYAKLFDGDAALQKKVGASEDWRIQIVGVRLSAQERSGNHGEATVTYDKSVRLTDRNLPEATSRHVASIVYQYQPQVLARERDRLENPLGFVVMAYRSDPEINTPAPGSAPISRQAGPAAAQAASRVQP
jgi:type IV secretion system protein VirB8